MPTQQDRKSATHGGMKMRRFKMLRDLFLVFVVAMFATQVSARAQTIDEIIKRGKVVIGVNTTTPIFGLMGKDGQPEGYDPDVARLVGKYLGVPDEFVSVT